MTQAGKSPPRDRGVRSLPDLTKKRLFVFDFDGTLVHSNAIKRQAYFDVTAGIIGARDVLEDILRSDSSLDRFGVFRKLARRISIANADDLTSAYTRLCEERIAAAGGAPGAYDVLAALKRSGRVGVVNSATPEEALRALVARLEFAHLLSAVYGKPESKAANMRRAMALAEVGPAETVVVGDGDDDRRTAHAFGCIFIAVESDNNNFTERPAALVKQLDELVVLL